VSDDFTRKKRKEKLDKKKDKRGRRNFDDGQSESFRDRGSKQKPRKRDWSVDGFMDDEYGYQEIRD